MYLFNTFTAYWHAKLISPLHRCRPAQKAMILDGISISEASRLGILATEASRGVFRRCSVHHFAMGNPENFRRRPDKGADAVPWIIERAGSPAAVMAAAEDALGAVWFARGLGDDEVLDGIRILQIMAQPLPYNLLIIIGVWPDIRLFYVFSAGRACRQ